MMGPPGPAGSAITSATLTAFALNLLFNHLPLRRPDNAPSAEPETAVS
jgi:hypothetical protein